jgi:PAS domain S-box-containing protein
MDDAAKLLDLLPDPVIGCDTDGTVVYWSRAAEETYGYRAAEARGRRVAALLHTRFPAPLLEITEELGDLGQWQGRLEHRCKDGRTVVVHSRWVTRHDDQGARIGSFAVDRELTGEMAPAAEPPGPERLDPAAPAAPALAHDFNNALGIIINYTAFVTAELESLGGAPDDPARKSMRADLSEIEAAAERALELSRRMLGGSEPARRPRTTIATAWTRVRAPSLDVALRTWVRTVSGERNSRSAIIWPLSPSASSSSTSTSRGRSAQPLQLAVLGQLAGKLRIDVGAARCDRAQRVGDARRRRGLEHEPARPGPHRLVQHRVRARVAGVQDDRRRRVLAQQVLDQADRALLPELHVEQGDVEAPPGEDGPGLLQRAGDPGDAEPGLTKQELDAPPHGEVVIDDDHLEFLGLHCTGLHG